MKISYLDHAVARMIERKISVAEVELLLTNPDGKIKQSLDKWIYYKALPHRTDNMVAIVAVEIKDDDYLVITILINFELRSLK